MASITSKIPYPARGAAPFGVESSQKKDGTDQDKPWAIIAFHQQYSAFYQQYLESKADIPWPSFLKFLQLKAQHSQRELEQKVYSTYCQNYPPQPQPMQVLQPPAQPKPVLQPPLVPSAFHRIHSFSPVEQLEKIANFYISLHRQEKALPHLKLALDIAPNNTELAQKIQNIEKALTAPEPKKRKRRKATYTCTWVPV
ncbi:MAG: hypothetical protein ACE5GN_06015 [Waddliaceae bacterium]